MRGPVLGDVYLIWAGVEGQGKKIWIGEKILLGEGRKILASPGPLPPGFIPAWATWLLYFKQPLTLSLSKAQLNSLAPHHAFPLPGMLFSSLHFSPCPTSLARRKERSQIEAGHCTRERHWLRNFQRGLLAVPYAKKVCEDGHRRRAGDSGLALV